MGHLPKFVPPQLSLLVSEAPKDSGWVHEIKYDGYRIAMRLRQGRVHLLTRSGLDWTGKYPGVAAAALKIKVDEAYLDGELCAVRPDGTTSFAGMQSATDSGDGALVFFAFDLLHLNGNSLMRLPLLERKSALRRLLTRSPKVIRYSDHFLGEGAGFHQKACEAQAEGIISKKADAPYLPGDRGKWLKIKCHQRAEFVVVGYSNPEGSRSHFGSLLLGYYTDAGKLMYAGRVGTGFSGRKLADIHKKLVLLEIEKMPLDVPPPKKTRFGSRLILSQVHWLKPKLVCEVRYLTWTADGLLRHTSFVGLREDKKAKDVRREVTAT